MQRLITMLMCSAYKMKFGGMAIFSHCHFQLFRGSPCNMITIKMQGEKELSVNLIYNYVWHLKGPFFHPQSLMSHKTWLKKRMVQVWDNFIYVAHADTANLSFAEAFMLQFLYQFYHTLHCWSFFLLNYFFSLFRCMLFHDPFRNAWYPI